MQTITGLYHRHVLRHPDKIAIRTATEEITYFEWNRIVCQTANWLTQITDAKETIGIFMPNHSGFLQLFSGAAMSGRIAATFDAKSKSAELTQRLAIASPSVIITTEALVDRIKDTDASVILWKDAQEKIGTYEPLFELDVEKETPFYMGFTSGTTGVPKAFIRAHESWIASFDCNRQDFQMDETDHVLIPGALIHSHFLYGAVSTLALGGTVYLMNHFSPREVFNLIEKFPVTVLYAVPTMLEAMLSENKMINQALKIICSGAKWEVDSKKRMKQYFPRITMFEFYGASELSFVTVLDDASNQSKPGSVGKACHNVELEIRNPVIDEATQRECGKIFVRSPMIFLGYLHPESGTIQPVTDREGWMTVDDVGYLDEDGYLYIVGREKNMILFGGVNIFPEEIETLLMTHKDVEEAVVIGIEDTYWGQIPVAVVKGSASKATLKMLCKDYLSPYKFPRKWCFVEDIPYTTTGKIARMQVKRLVESREGATT